MKTVLVTGGAGFIGSAFLRKMVRKYPDYLFINFDKLTYAGNLENLIPIQSTSNYRFVKGDICSNEHLHQVFLKYHPSDVLNFAAESHVDRSIQDTEIFVKTNVLGVQNLLYFSKEFDTNRFVQISTDEVYGSLPDAGYFTEETPLAPNSPYSASKVGGDALVRAYSKTYGMNTVVTRCSNNYGAYQFPEKFIPLMILNALSNKPLPLYGDGKNIRDWLHVDDHCDAIDLVWHKGKASTYNIGGNNEKQNIDVAKQVLNLLGKPLSLIQFVADRLGHDRRYAIDASKIKKELGWSPSVTFEKGLESTAEWYLSNEAWCEKVRTGKYREISFQTIN